MPRRGFHAAVVRKGMRPKSLVPFLLSLTAACSSPAEQPAPSQDLEVRCADALADIRMPFEYQLPAESGVDQIRVRTASGGYRDLTFGPWGAHASPHTGHPEGNAKADMMLPYTIGYDALTYLPDDEVDCTAENFYDGDEVQCGLPAADVYADRFGYVAPLDGYEIVSLYKEFELDVETSNYAFDAPQWKVSMRRAVGDCNLGLSFGHIAWLGEGVIAELEQRGIDWENAPVGENLSDFENPIPVAAGEVVAYPQIVGRPSEIADGYVVPHVEAPSLWTQIEFFVNVEFQNEAYEWQAYHVPVYRGLDDAEYDVWSAIFEQNVQDPENPRYGTAGAQARRWLWAAEGELILDDGFHVTESDGLLSALGSWWEGSPDCASDSTLCDEMVTFFPIYRDTALFAGVSSEFDVDTRYVVGKVWGVDQSRIFGEVVGVYEYVDDAFVSATGLEEVLRGAIVLRQRTELAPDDVPMDDTILGYQTVAFDLDPVAGRLVFAWGALRDDEGAAIADVPAAPPTQDAPCTGDSQLAGSTTCHHKGWQQGWISAQNVYP